MTIAHDPLPPAHLVWIDVEFTGVELTKDYILEVAARATTADLAEIGTPFNEVCQPGSSPLRINDRRVAAMHKKSGLLKAVSQSSLQLPDLDELFQSWLIKVGGDTNPLLHCGYFLETDRAFMLRQLPKSAAMLGHRAMDLRSLEEAMDAWTPLGRFKRRTPRHRAADDVIDAIELASRYWSFFSSRS